MKRFLLILAACALASTVLVSCGNVDQIKGRQVLEGQGYTDIQFTGYSAIFSGCAKGDSFNSAFKAKDKNGREVTGILCSGWVKGMTVRYD